MGNVTDASPPERDPSHSKGKVRVESTADGWGDTTQPVPPAPITIDCGTTDNCGILTVHPESTVTGWEVITDGVMKATMLGPQTSSTDKLLIATSTPTLVGIHTEIQPSTQPGAARPAGTPNDSPISAESGPAPGPSLATPTSDPLLLDIISHLVPTSSSPPGSLSSPDFASTPVGGSVNPEHGTNEPAQPSNVTPGPAITAPPSASVVSLGSQITLGSSVLTLTPGLSSTIGDGTTATYVAITTDETGHTLITVSSSGTAVTATITNAPATITQLKTQYDSTITTAARPGTFDGSPSGKSATTSSKGAAASQKAEFGRWLYAGVGIAGFGLVVG